MRARVRAVSRERRGSGGGGVPWRQFLIGSALVATGIFVAVTRDNASEWLVGTLVGLGLLAIGVALPAGFPFKED